MKSAADNSASLFLGPGPFQDLTLSVLNLIEPLAQNGKIDISPLDGLDYSLTVGIEQLQLEQDTGKSLHDVYPDMTLMDLNRAGTGLMEIVTKPDMRTSKEAGILVKKLQALLRAVNSSDGNMDEVHVDLQVHTSDHQLAHHETLSKLTGSHILGIHEMRRECFRS